MVVVVVGMGNDTLDTVGVRQTANVNMKVELESGSVTQSEVDTEQDPKSTLPLSSTVCCAAGISPIITERLAVESSGTPTTVTLPFIYNSSPITGREDQ